MLRRSCRTSYMLNIWAVFCCSKMSSTWKTKTKSKIQQLPLNYFYFTARNIHFTRTHKCILQSHCNSFAHVASQVNCGTVILQLMLTEYICTCRFISLRLRCNEEFINESFYSLTFSILSFQGYPLSLQSDYQPIGGGMINSGAVMSSSVDYHQLGRHTPNHHPSLDWSTDYQGNG